MKGLEEMIAGFLHAGKDSCSIRRMYVASNGFISPAYTGGKKQAQRGKATS